MMIQVCDDKRRKPIERKINFYNEVFKEPHVNERFNKNKKKNKHNKERSLFNNEPQPKDEKTIVKQKLENLKSKKVKFIKKMQAQKTSRGQPIMRNMIKYALTKIEENINKEKLEKLVKD